MAINREHSSSLVIPVTVQRPENNRYSFRLKRFVFLKSKRSNSWSDLQELLEVALEPQIPRADEGTRALGSPVLPPPDSHTSQPTTRHARGTDCEQQHIKTTLQPLSPTLGKSGDSHHIVLYLQTET